MPLEAGVNSYVTLEEATEYFDLQGETSVLSAEVISLAGSERTLLLAARSVDSRLFHSCKKTSTQTLEFPRDYQDDVPEVVKEAQLEEAIALAQYALSSRRKIQEEGVKSISVGKASETYDETVLAEIRQGKLKSPLARRLLRPFVLGTAPIS